MASLDAAIHGEMARISQPQMAIHVTQLKANVDQYLKEMGFSW